MILVMVGSALSIASFGLGYVETLTGKPPVITEFYPFFHWRLYGDPKGATGTHTYRIYSRNSESDPWTRHAIKETNGWSRYRYSFQLNKRARILVGEMESIRQNEQEVHLDTLAPPTEYHKFVTFTRSVLGHVPAQIKLVRESYYPLDLLSDSTAYDTTTVVHIIR